MSLFQYLDGEQQEQPPAMSITVGVVTSIEDPDKRGRVKVKLLNRTTSDYETDFIRVVSPCCGEKWGIFFLPEVGDEVVLGFCDGDITRPYVLGSLWNKSRTMPAALEENKENNTRVIKSKSGHTLTFYDKDSKEYVELQTAKGLKLRLDDEKTIITVQDKDGKNLLSIDGSAGEVKVTADKKLELAAGDSKITLDGTGKKISISSGGTLEMSAQQVKVDAKSTLSLQGQTSVEMKSAAVLSIEANATASLKGKLTKIN